MEGLLHNYTSNDMCIWSFEWDSKNFMYLPYTLVILGIIQGDWQNLFIIHTSDYRVMESVIKYWILKKKIPSSFNGTI
jgi:hypothetical protein